MTDYTDLIARLRNIQSHAVDSTFYGNVADALEAQARRIAELELENDRITDAGLKTIAEMSARIAELEAALSKLHDAVIADWPATEKDEFERLREELRDARAAMEKRYG